MFTEIQKQRLKATVRPRYGNEYQSTTNDELNELIAQLRLESPERFLTDYSIEKRVFFHQPRQVIPMAGYKVKLRVWPTEEQNTAS